jgi:hypothetical protein
VGWIDDSSSKFAEEGRINEIIKVIDANRIGLVEMAA